MRISRLVVIALLLAGFVFAQEDSRPVLRVATANMSSTVDPGADHSNVGSQNMFAFFDSLIERDHTKVEPTFIPGLATEWAFVDDVTLELKLRPNVKFHNGETMTAEDVKFSIERILNGEHAPYENIRGQFFDSLERVDIVDPETVRVVTKRADPALLTLLSTTQMSIVPKAYLEEIGYDAFALAPVGTGPFKLAEFTPGETMTWEAFADFWGDQPNVSKVELRRIPELSARITALANNEVDLITNVPPDQVEVITNNSGLEVREYQTPIFHVVIYNTKHPVMADKRFRQALNLAIDRQLLVDALWNGKAVAPNGHWFPQFGPLYDANAPLLAYDPEQAKALIAESGYDGTPIRFDTSAVYYTNGLLSSQALQEMWAAVGVNMELNVDDKWTGDDADMMARNWSNPMYFPDPAGSYGVMWGPTGARVPKTWEPQTPEYNALYEQMRFGATPEERMIAFKQVLEIWYDEAPGTILYQPMEYYGIRKGVNWQPLPGHQPYTLDFRAYNLSMSETISSR